MPKCSLVTSEKKKSRKACTRTIGLGVPSKHYIYGDKMMVVKCSLWVVGKGRDYR